MDKFENKRWMVNIDGLCVWAYDTKEEADEHLEAASRYHVQGYNHAYVLQQESGCYPMDYPYKWEHLDSRILLPEKVALEWVLGCKYSLCYDIFINKDYYVVGREIANWNCGDRRIAIYKHDNKVWFLREREEVK